MTLNISLQLKLVLFYHLPPLKNTLFTGTRETGSRKRRRSGRRKSWRRKLLRWICAAIVTLVTVIPGHSSSLLSGRNQRTKNWISGQCAKYCSSLSCVLSGKLWNILVIIWLSESVCFPGKQGASRGNQCSGLKFSERRGQTVPCHQDIFFHNFSKFMNNIFLHCFHIFHPFFIW